MTVILTISRAFHVSGLCGLGTGDLKIWPGLSRTKPAIKGLYNVITVMARTSRASHVLGSWCFSFRGGLWRPP